MATNPYFTQYHTQRFSFIGSPQQRDGTYQKDQRFLNMYPELIKSPISDGKKYYLKKRPGLSTFMSMPTGTSQGIYYWASNNTYYTAIGGIVYQGTTPLISLSNSTNTVGFAEFRTDTEYVLFVCDGIAGWVVTANNVVSHITDPGFPNPHIATPVFLDGYMFLPQPGSQIIRNSKATDPMTWPADGFIDAEMFPDSIAGIFKVQNYIAAVGFESIEWFYDNANTTGSPLQRNAPAVSQFGCPAIATVNQTEKELILVGQTGNGGRTVWKIDGFQPTEIANEPVREALDYEGSNIGGASACTIQVAGHKFYILNLTQSQRTFIYDFEEQMWSEWSSGTGQAVFPSRFSADSGYGRPVFLGYTGGPILQMDPNVYTDVGAVINCVATTVKIDFDTEKRKRFYRLSLIGDAPNGNTTVPLTIKWSDDDYTTWSPGVNMNVNATYPTVTQLGYSRRRAFQFIFQQPYALRLESFEVDIVQEVRR